MVETEKKTQMSLRAREELVARITARLAEVDDRTLRELDRMTAETAPQVLPLAASAQTMSRRRFLGAAVAAGAVVTVAGGAAAYGWGRSKGAELADALLEVTHLRELLALYEQLEAVALDPIVTAGLVAVSSALGLVAGASGLLADGLELGESLLERFTDTFPRIRSGLEWLQGLVTALSEKVQAVEDAIGQALETVSPLTEALSPFFALILDALPFGIGDTVRTGLDRIGELISSIPEAIEGINTRVLEPLEGLFSDAEEEGLKGTLINPLIAHVFDPGEALLGNLTGLATVWEEQLEGPSKAAIGRREEIRKDIRDYKQAHGLE